MAATWLTAMAAGHLTRRPCQTVLPSSEGLLDPRLRSWEGQRCGRRCGCRWHSGWRGRHGRRGWWCQVRLQRWEARRWCSPVEGPTRARPGAAAPLLRAARAQRWRDGEDTSCRPPSTYRSVLSLAWAQVALPLSAPCGSSCAGERAGPQARRGGGAGANAADAAGASAADMVPGLEENVATRGLVLVR